MFILHQQRVSLHLIMYRKVIPSIHLYSYQVITIIGNQFAFK